MREVKCKICCLLERVGLELMSDVTNSFRMSRVALRVFVVVTTSAEEVWLPKVWLRAFGETLGR